MIVKSARIASLAFIALTWPVLSVAQDSMANGDSKHGAQIFKAVGCWECHGTVGQGGGSAGPRLAATALPYDALLHQLRVPRSAMPPYEAALVTDTEATDIYAFLRALPEPKAAKDIPLLNALN
jgi:ubiquinol-cytochrome c reductase cytochrome c subunit